MEGRSLVKLRVGPAIPDLFLPFPVAFLAAALVSDVLFLVSHATMWTNASLWLIGACVVALPIAAMAGFGQARGRGRAAVGLSGQQLGYLGAIALVMLDWYPRFRHGTAWGFSGLGALMTMAALMMVALIGWGGVPAFLRPLGAGAGHARVVPASLADNSLPGR
jgi:uncharacterized membrane protein